MKKNAFTLVELLAIIVIMASMLLIILPSINNTIKNSEEKKKQDALNSIYMATENYLIANYDEYSSLDDIGAVEYVYITDLISNNYLSIDTVNPNNDLAFNNKDAVKVTKKQDGTFSYELIYLKTLIETLLEQYNSENTTGLVKDSSNLNLYYYTGTNEVVSNNFLWYGGHQWRIIEFDTEENTLTLITQQPLTAIQPASAVWKTQEAYESSYINTWLNDYFWNSLDSNIKNNILDSTFNIGIYTDVDEIKTTQKVGLLDENQYVRAGSADSFLDIKDYFWIGNRYDLSNVRYINLNGDMGNNSASSCRGVRAVIKISDLIITGDGTLASNYKVESKSTNIDNVQVGEYINVPYSGSDKACGEDNMCTFRVVSKNNDSIKVVLNGLLPTTSAWANDANDNITTNDLIYTSVLNGFIENIDSKYITTGTYGVGMYENGNSYIVPQSTTITTNIGLPTVGEMFSGNDIDMGNIKTFVDMNTIENPIASIIYWTANRYTSSSVSCVFSHGSIGSNYVSEYYGVRPVIYLKLGLKFGFGDGTSNSPYVLQ